MSQLTLPLYGECRCAKVTLRITAEAYAKLRA
jgi:hypothetical protein